MCLFSTLYKYKPQLYFKHLHKISRFSPNIIFLTDIVFVSDLVYDFMEPDY